MDRDTLFRYLSRFMGIDVLVMMEDTVYMIKRPNHPPQQIAKIQDLKQRYKNGAIMGGCFGMALVLSLRRYFPAFFSQFSVNRALIELTVLGGSLFASTLAVVMGGAKVVHSLKKQYILKADQHYYNHMSELASRYLLDEESQVRMALSQQQFNEWRRYRFQALSQSELRL